jgi:superfamily II DNA/RNA helicase
MLNIDNEQYRIKRDADELKKFVTDAHIHYDPDSGIPKPALTFDEAWKGLSNQTENIHAAEASRKILSALNQEPSFEGPTPIQAACWPLINTCRDILGISKTGSGKTLAFGLPVLLRCYVQQKTTSRDERIGSCTCLIMVHTRDLAKQHAEVLSKWGEHLGVRVMACYGGDSVRNQIAQIRDGVDIIVATTGRLLHFLSQEELTLKNTTMIVLDEADEMLSQGFKDQIYKIFQYMHNDAQIGKFCKSGL